jgi:hypothetical protein
MKNTYIVNDIDKKWMDLILQNHEGYKTWLENAKKYLVM